MKSGSRYLAESAFDRFRSLLASSLATEESNVDIVSVQDVVSYAPSKVIDVRYAVRGSPYYPSSQSDGAVLVNKDKVLRAISGRYLSCDPVSVGGWGVYKAGHGVQASIGAYWMLMHFVFRMQIFSSILY